MPRKKRIRKCVAAGKVLPPRLVREIQRHHQGMLWIPVVRRRRALIDGMRNRNAEIARKWRAGATVSRLASKYALTAERIRQILRREKGWGK